MNYEKNNNDASDNAPNFYDADYRPSDQKHTTDPEVFRSPKLIYDYLEEHVWGHPIYKEKLSLFIWKHLHGHTKGALLVAGESGSGKTEMLRAISSVYSNIEITDASVITPAGYRGTDLASVVSSLDFTDKQFPPILVLDEADKLFTRPSRELDVMPELLKFIEGGTYNSGTTDKPRYINTTGLGVIMLGSFSALTENKSLNAIGFNASSKTDTSSKAPLSKQEIMKLLPIELRGRIQNVVILNSLTEQDFHSILTDERYSPIYKLCREYDLRKFSFSDEKLQEICHEAFISKSVRSLYTAVSAYLDEELFSDCNVKEVSIE